MVMPASTWGTRPPPEELVDLFDAQIVKIGRTTAAGAAAGNSIIDNSLIGSGPNSFLQMNVVLYPGVTKQVDSLISASFNNTTGEITLNRAYKNTAVAIPAGVQYVMMTVAGGGGGLTPTQAAQLASIYTVVSTYLDAAVSSRAVPGDQMSLTPAVLLAIQALILSDTTPFPGADIALIKTQTDKIPTLQGGPLILSSDPVASITLNAGPVTIALPSITIAGLPAGAVLDRADAVLKFREVSEDSTADNSLSGAQVIQAQKAVAGAWITAINCVNGQIFCLASSRGSGDALMGSADIKAQVPANGAVIDFQWLSALAVGASLILSDVQVVLRMWFHIA
jgi:hypothetical protein